MMIRNIFRSNKNKALADKPGHYSPCSHCWRWTCKNCLVFFLVDFSLVLRESPSLSSQFEALYSKKRGNTLDGQIKVKKVKKKKKKVKK